MDSLVLSNRHHIGVRMAYMKIIYLLVGEIVMVWCLKRGMKECLRGWRFNGLIKIGDNSSHQDNLLKKD